MRTGMIEGRQEPQGEMEMKMKKTVLCAALAVLSLLSPAAYAAEEALVPVGRAVGIVMDVDGVIVEDVTSFRSGEGTVSPAEDAGLMKGDVILALDGETVNGTESLNALLAERDGKTSSLAIRRGGKELNLKVTPALDAAGGQVRIGVLATEKISGIGTVTYYDPETGKYGALGHGIHAGKGGCSAIEEGELYDVTLTGVRRGQHGAAGELHGSIVGESVGSAEKNTPYGVFGVAEKALFEGDALPVAEKEDLHTGRATILSEVYEGEQAAYEIEITEIADTPDAAKSISFRVKDKALLEKTGGVVRGMSGSPIVQDGHLIGAVTHVLISDPTEGYGIYIGDMLKAA